MSLLLDTGALVTLLDRSQRNHREFAAFFSSWRGPVVSTEAVLAESCHLLGRVDGGRTACLDFFLSGGGRLVPQSPAALARCRELVVRYGDVPMDYTDATLVVLAEDLQADHVFTTDRTDFSIYRIGRKRPFKIVP